ncbi:unnamed protein product [Prunus armeniaca]
MAVELGMWGFDWVMMVVELVSKFVRYWVGEDGCCSCWWVYRLSTERARVVDGMHSRVFRKH